MILYTSNTVTLIHRNPNPKEKEIKEKDVHRLVLKSINEITTHPSGSPPLAQKWNDSSCRPKQYSESNSKRNLSWTSAFFVTSTHKLLQMPYRHAYTKASCSICSVLYAIRTNLHQLSFADMFCFGIKVGNSFPYEGAIWSGWISLKQTTNGINKR